MKKQLLSVLLGTLVFTGLSHAQWSLFCPGQTSNGTIVDFVTFENQLYATGFFKKICGQDAKYIARLNGTAWEQPGTGLSDEGHALEVIDGELYVAKYELGVDSNWLYKWDGATFQKTGPALWRTNPNPNNSQTASIYDVLQYNDQIVICGEFNRAANKSISGIARWNGGTWDSLGAGLSGNIANTPPVLYPHQLLRFGNDLIVAGNFQKAGGQIANGIARWDGMQWHPMGAGFNSTVYAIGIFAGELYAGGDFTKSGGVPLFRIAKWNGIEWVDPGFSFPNGGPNDYIFVHTIKELNGLLYIAGGLKKVDSNGSILNCGGIVSFDGNTVNTLDGGIANNDIEAVTTLGNGILAGGGVFGSGYLATFGDISDTETLLSENVVQISPNPSSGLITINMEVTSEAPYQIFDVQGNLVQNGTVNEGASPLNLTHLPKGTYFMRLFFDAKTMLAKIVLID